MTPDAWDECTGCGHDRDDHEAAGCNVITGTTRCPCAAFAEEHG